MLNINKMFCNGTIITCGDNVTIINGKVVNGNSVVPGNNIQKEVDQEKIVKFTSALHQIEIAASWADVFIIEEERSDIKVHLCGKFSSYPEINPILVVNELDDTLVIRVKQDADSISISNSSVKLNVYVPKNFSRNIYVETNSGDMYTSKMELNTLHFTSASGDFKADSLVANVSIKTASGDARLKNFSGSFSMNSMSGDANLSYKIFNSDIQINTMSGDLKITLPENAEFRVNASTMTGEFECEFPIKLSGRHNGRVGKNPHHQIILRTMSGDIELNSK